MHCSGSCVVSLCSQWREQAFRDGSSVCHRNPSGCLSQGACFSLLPKESMNVSHVNPSRCMYSTFMAVVVWPFGTPSLSVALGSLLSDRRAPAHSSLWSPGSLLLCDELTVAAGPRAAALQPCWLSAFRFSLGPQSLASKQSVNCASGI